MNQLITVLACVFFAGPVFASCIAPTSTSGEKAVLGAAAKEIMGSATSWMEVKADTNIKETRNTILMKVNYSDPFKTTFSVGPMRAHLTKMCIEGGKVVVATNRGQVQLWRNGGYLLVQARGRTFFMLPSNQVVSKTAELQPAPTSPDSESGVLL